MDKIDSEITTKVLQLMDVQQTLQNQHGNTFMNEKLDLAFIYFFQQFKKSYMSESNGRDVSRLQVNIFMYTDRIIRSTRNFPRYLVLVTKFSCWM
jgi:exportin-7